LIKLHYLPGTSVTADQHDLALARQFFERNSQAPGPSSGLSMSHYLLPTQLGEMNMRVESDFNEGWAMEQQHRLQAFEVSEARALWAAEFGSSSQLSGPSIQQHVVPQSDSE
jgi:peroxin-5